MERKGGGEMGLSSTFERRVVDGVVGGMSKRNDRGKKKAFFRNCKTLLTSILGSWRNLCINHVPEKGISRRRCKKVNYKDIVGYGPVCRH